MMHVALYRKYRSATFDDVYGQDHITSVLKYQSKNGRVSHAYLFCGSRGTGKTSCAKILAKAVNCESPIDGNPCGKCEACLSIDRGIATDVMEMDAASDTGVDYIRSIKEEVQYAPALLNKRVYIIDEVHMLSESAFNALLKTLEEPPEHVIFILATTELYKLPSTVISRCQRFDFRRISVETICRRLAFIAEKENIVLEDEAAKIIAKQAQGGMRDAISLFELCSGGGADVTVSRVSEILGISGYESVCETALAIASRDTAKLFDTVKEVCASSKDISVFWQELTSFYRDMLIAKYAKDPKEYLDLTDTEYKLLSEASSEFTLAKLYYQSKILDSAMKEMNRMPHVKRMTAEFALVRMCDETLDPSVDALLSRIETLENTVALLKSGVPIPDEAMNDGVIEPSAPEKSEEAKKDPEPHSEDKSENGMRAETKKEPVRPASSGSFRKVPDLSEVAEKVGTKDFMCRALLADAEALLSEDGSEIRIVSDNPFAATYFTNDICKAVSEAFIICKLHDRNADVKIVIKKNGGDGDISDELFDKIQ